MTKGKTTLGERLRQLHAMLGSKNKQEVETALNAINALLEKHRKGWPDIPALLAGTSSDPIWNVVEDGDDQNDAPQDLSLIDMVLAVVTGHVDVTADEALVMALWILLTHHYAKFEYSPRLALLSPVKGCGKTTALKALKYLCARPRLMNSVTPAMIYRVIDRDHPTLLIDEGDNLGLNLNSTIRSIMNGGHNVGSDVGRVIKGAPTDYETFGPLAIAAIGTLPLTLMDRSVIIHMEKSQRRDLRRLDPNSPNIKVVEAVYREICKWAGTPLKNDIDAILPNDPTRHADNWRPLICIADSFGKAWGRKARAAADAYKNNYSDDDLRVILLTDIRTVFNQLNVDRVTSEQLVKEIRGINDLWDEYPRPNGTTRKLTTSSMTALLKVFRPRIKSGTIWPRGRKRGDTAGSGKGYLRAAFETAWSKYCSASEPAAPSNVLSIR